MKETVKIKRRTYDKLMADSIELQSGKIYFADYNGYRFYVYGNIQEPMKILEQTNQELQFKVEELKNQLSDCRNKKWYQFWK